jgi:hypothetical protein
MRRQWIRREQLAPRNECACRPAASATQIALDRPRLPTNAIRFPLGDHVATLTTREQGDGLCPVSALAAAPLTQAPTTATTANAEATLIHR